METFLVKALQLILSLSILVLVHEFGHFIFARIFKVRVEKFYLFFDPWFSIFKFKPKNSDTEYGVGWLPLGGYCKISGMIDESMDKEAMAQPPKPYEFRSKPAGQRLMIMVAGVLFNFLLALFIYSMVLFTWGDTFLPLKNVKAGMDYSETFHNVGFQDGDILLKADDTELERFGEDCFRRVLNAQTVTVLRGGVETVIPIPEDMAQRVMRDKKGFASYRFPMVVRELGKTESGESPAAVAGLQPGDSIVSINGIVTPSFYEVGEVLAQNKDKDVLVGFYRAGIPQTLTLYTDTAGKMGIYSVSPFDMYQTVTRKYGFFESFPAGVMLGVNTLKGYVSDMKYVFTKEGASSLGGFGTIGSLFPAEWDWHSFWMKTAFLSIILAFMNILPIPALDGGHVMFLLYEVIARRKPSDKFLEYAQVTGMFLLFALLIYANGNDIFRFFFK
ncbi:MAG: RIP metalloprotease RseP [Parabacteroides merdae]